MAEARESAAWTRTATVLALIECVSAAGKTRFDPAKWNPFSTAAERSGRGRGEPITAATIGLLKVFVKKKKKKKSKPKPRKTKGTSK